MENAFSADVGFDAKYGVTKSLIADFTVNTDFAQVEADEEQVNLTRFSLFFPDKREFFLEGQGIFAFGGASGGGFQWGQNSYTPVMFFSRRIGLAGGEQTPIRAGGRLTGRAGRYTIGLLNIQTGEKEAVAARTNFSVVRLRRDLFRRSNIGAIFTNRSVALDGNGSNQLYGFDANFSFFQNLVINAYYSQSQTAELSGNDTSYLAKLENNGDRYGAELEHLMVGDAFNPEVGFLRRDAFRRTRARAYFSPRPATIKSVRKIPMSAEVDYFHDLEGVLETRQYSGDLRRELENGDGASVEYRSSFEFLSYPFEIVDGVVIPVGGYDFDRVEASYELGTQRRVTGRLSFETGGFFGGTRSEASYWGRVELTPQLSVEPSVSVNWIDLAEGSFTTELLRARVSYALSPRMFASALVQYNSDSSSLGTNVRFRWEFEPGSDIFVVYNDGCDTRFGGYPRLENRGLVVKVTKLVRFSLTGRWPRPSMALRATKRERSGVSSMKKRLFAFICLIATSAVAGDSVVMRVGNVLGDPEEGGEPHHMVRTQRYFAKLVREKTGGEVEVRFLEGKSLPTFQMLGMVTKGEIEATNVPGFFLSKVPELGVQTIPYLFEGLEHARRFPRSQAADYLAAKIENAYGVHVVSFMQIASSASINALEPIRMPGDFEGKKVANIWELYRAMYDGYPPAHLREVGYRESVEGGLVSGEFDVAIGQLQNTHHQKLYEYYTHQTVAPWLYNIYYTFIVNADFWNRLTAEQHQAIDQAAREAELAAVNFAEDASQAHFLLMAEAGVAMHRQTKAEREAWKAAFEKPVVDAVVKRTGDAEATMKLIQWIQDLYP